MLLLLRLHLGGGAGLRGRVSGDGESAWLKAVETSNQRAVELWLYLGVVSGHVAFRAAKTPGL